MADYEDENDFHIPNRMGISTRYWGDDKEGFVPSGKFKKEQLRKGKFVPGDVQMAYNKLLEDGILLFETSPEYGPLCQVKIYQLNISLLDVSRNIKKVILHHY
jgi:hypothetical protein